MKRTLKKKKQLRIVLNLDFVSLVVTLEIKVRLAVKYCTQLYNMRIEKSQLFAVGLCPEEL